MMNKKYQFAGLLIVFIAILLSTFVLFKQMQTNNHYTNSIFNLDKQNNSRSANYKNETTNPNGAASTPDIVENNSPKTLETTQEGSGQIQLEDYGSHSLKTWGTEDEDYQDISPSHWEDETIMVDLETRPPLNSKLILFLKAKTDRPPDSNAPRFSNLDYDVFGTYLYINGVGGHYEEFDTWQPVYITSPNFDFFSLSMPSDLDDDEEVDWKKGENEIRIKTWSSYNLRPSKTYIDYMFLDSTLLPKFDK